MKFVIALEYGLAGRPIDIKTRGTFHVWRALFIKCKNFISLYTLNLNFLARDTSIRNDGGGVSEKVSLITLASISREIIFV
jgi:hypothetical protein